MVTDCRLLNPLQRDGTSQRQRLVAALDPSYVSVDERNLADLLNYARRYARLLKYYSPTNTSAGDWVDFIEHDISALVSMIGATDTDAFRRRFEESRDAVSAVAPSGRAAGYGALFRHLLDLAQTFDDWYRGSADGLALRGTLRRLIGSSLNDALRATLSQALRAESLGVRVVPLEPTALAGIWELSEILPDLSLFPSGDITSEEDLDDAVGRLSAQFERFFEALVFVVSRVPSYLEETLQEYPEHQPHMALFLAFLGVFRHAQVHLNTLTAAHLDFYYREVLGLEPRGQVSDQVHVVFELAKNFATHSLARGTPLKAGKDSTGVELIYATDSELVVNRAVLHEEDGLKTVFVDKDESSGVAKGIYAAPDADSADGRGAEIEDEDGKWSTFGGPHMPYARIGFALASPMFLLAEGTRVVEVILHTTSPHFLAGQEVSAVEKELAHNVTVEASGVKTWLPVSVDQVDISEEMSYVRFTLRVSPEEGPVVAFDKRQLEGDLDTTLPVIRFLLDNEGLPAGSIGLSPTGEPLAYSDEVGGYPHGTLVRHMGSVYQAKVGIQGAGLRPTNHPELWRKIEFSYPYRYFDSMEIRQVDIALDVTGVKGLVLENDAGPLDPAKPFHPFGPVPRVGSRLLIGSHEVFQKHLTRVGLNLTWADLPGESFKDYYSHYGNAPSSNGDFKATLHVLQDGDWVPRPLPEEAVALFTDNDRGDGSPAPSRTLGLKGELVAFQRDSSLTAFDRFDTTLRQGFLKLELQTSFLHRDYPRLLAEAAATGSGDIPAQPYTPLVASLTLDYRATEEIPFAKQRKEDFESRVERLFQIGPFGQREIFPIPDGPTGTDVPIIRRLVPAFPGTVHAPSGTSTTKTAEGTLYIGLEDLTPPQNLSLLFQVAEGSEDPETQAQDVTWSYMAAGHWLDFKASELIADGTNGLLRSGVLKLAMPKSMTTRGSLLTAGLHWIKASVVKDSKAVPKLISVKPQAGAASFRDRGNDPQHLGQALAAGTITKLKSREAAIKSLEQPYASFGGRMRESNEAFYVRVSERLRHKGRAVTIFDYERLVLERFPDVYKVRCLNHTSRASEYASGHVRLVVVPNLRNKNAVDPLQPRLSLNRLEEIRDYLARLASPFVRIEVANPSYEEVRVRLKVRFHHGRDKGLYTTRLEQDVVRFLSPWLYDDAADLVFGGRIHRSAILNHVEEREYVDFVTSFELDHIVADTVRSHVEEAEASSSSSALVAAKSHLIDTNVTSCEDAIHRRRTCEEPEEPAEPPPAQEAPPFQLPPGSMLYLGNTRSRELHDLSNLTDFCQIGEIAVDRRYYFSRVTAATSMGYDFCAYCFPRGLSKR